MSNKQLFIDGYLQKLSMRYQVTRDIAFEIFAIAAILDMTFDEVFDSVLIRGKDDGGIDGIYFEEQGQSYVIHVFQCKNSPSLKPNQIDKFRNDFQDVFIHSNRANRPHLDDLQPKIEEYKNLSANGFIIEPRLYFLYNGSNNDPDRGGNTEAYTAYHKPGYFEVWDSEDIYQKIMSLIQAQNQRKDVQFVFKPESSNVSLRDNQGLYSYSISNVRAVNFRIRAMDLCDLVQKERSINSTDEHLFAKNIRSYLGLRTRANKSMQATLNNREESVYFPFLNNGVTIICQKLTIPIAPQNGQYLVPVVNPVIVNGLQTTRVLYNTFIENSQNLDNVFLNIRLYETDDTDLIDKITDATNTQTPISFSDKLSNKDFNQFAKVLFENNNIGYITKRGETFSNAFSIAAKETVKSETVLKYWYATFYEKPDVAKNSISTVLEEVYDATNSNSPLHKLFTGDKDSPVYPQLLYSYLIYRYIQEQKKRHIHQKEFVAHADELLSYGVYKYLEPSLRDIHTESRLEEAYQYAYGVIDTIVGNDMEQHRKSGKVFSYAGYFKRPKCKVDYDREAGIIEDENLFATLLS